MKSSSKGASEKRRLTQYVTNTTLDDNYKDTTEQFVLHFNEQFRQLEKFLIHLNISLHKSNYSCCEMQSDLLMI